MSAACPHCDGGNALWNCGYSVGAAIEMACHAYHISATQSRIEALESALATLADQHHRTLRGSKLHDPERVSDWRDCACLTCRGAATVLQAGGEARG